MGNFDEDEIDSAECDEALGEGAVTKLCSTAGEEIARFKALREEKIEAAKKFKRSIEAGSVDLKRRVECLKMHRASRRPQNQG